MDKHIVADMQSKFPENWALTSSHAFRESDDMQFSFSYFHFVMVRQRGTYRKSLFGPLFLNPLEGG